MNGILIWILIGILFISNNAFAHEDVEKLEEHDKINYNFEEFYLPIIVVSSIIGMTIFNLKKPVGEDIERS